MKTQELLLRKPPTFCTYKGECDFKKPVSDKNTPASATGRVICTWEGRCNQQQTFSPQRPARDNTHDD